MASQTDALGARSIPLPVSATQAGDLPRVLMFCPQFRPRIGGSERQAELLSGALRGNGMAVEIVTPRFEKAWPAEELIRGVPVHRFPYLRLPRLGRSLRAPGVPATLWNGVVIGRVIRSLASRFDILHAHNASTPMVALAVREAHRAGLQTAVSAVSTGSWFDLEVLRRDRLWGSLSTRWLRKHTDVWLAKSAAIQSNLRAAGIGSDRIASLPNGVVVPAKSRDLPEVASRFLYLGRLATTAPRDIIGLIEAFERAALPAGELALVGGGDQLEEIRRRVSCSKIAHQIHAPGDEDPERWLAWAHCLVQPSFVEGFSNALLEGMAAGLACVAYDIPPNREALDDGQAGILIPSAGRAELTQALRDLGTRPKLARSWGLSARRRAEQAYDIFTISSRAATLYRTLRLRPDRAARVG